MRINLRLIGLAFLVGMFSCGIIWAQDKAPEVKQEKAPAATQEKALEAKQEEAPTLDPAQMADFSKEVAMLSDMVTFAEANKDSLIMIGAVRILDSLPFEGVAKPDSDEKSDARYDRNEMLKQAKEYASGDKEVLAMVAKLEEVPEPTDVRAPGGHRHGGIHGGHHRGGHHRGGHRWGGYHGGYHGGGYWHHRRHRCVWFLSCGGWGCEWVCR